MANSSGASSAANCHQDTTTTTSAGESRFQNSCQDILLQVPNYHRNQHHHFLSSSNSAAYEKHDSVRFISQLEQEQQQQQQIYESRQEHKSFAQSACDCYQRGGNQICSRCQTNEEQNNAGAFVYQTIQTDDADVHSSSNSTSEPTQDQTSSIVRQRQLTSYSSTPAQSLSSISDNKNHDIAFQEPIYENKYYLKQELEYPNYNNNNNNTIVCSENNDSISDSVRYQTTCSFKNSNDNDNNNDNIIINGHDPGQNGIRSSSSSSSSGHSTGSSGHPFYRCTNGGGTGSSGLPAQYLNQSHDTTDNDDWKVESLVNLCDQDKLLFGCQIDSNNNTTQTPPQEAQQISARQHYHTSVQIAAHDVKKSPCHLGYSFNNNNNDNNYTSIQQYGNYQQASHQCEPAPYCSSFDSPALVSTATNQQMTQLGVYNLPSLGQHEQKQGLPFVADSSSPDQQLCFLPSSNDGQSSGSTSDECKMSTLDETNSTSPATSNKSKGRRKNPTTLSKLNNRLSWLIPSFTQLKS